MSYISQQIDDLDNINQTGTLENITFYQKKPINNQIIKNDKQIKVDNLINGDIIDLDILIDEQQKNVKMFDDNFMYYSQFFVFDTKKENEKKIGFNYKNMILESIIIILLNIFIKSNVFINLITIDGIFSCFIFFTDYLKKSYLHHWLKNRLITFDRYLYYGFLFCCHVILSNTPFINLIYSSSIMLILSLLANTQIMMIINNFEKYKQIRLIIYCHYNNFIKKLVCKQLTKIINLLVSNGLNMNNVKIHYTELLPYYDEFSLVVINKFIVTFVIACIFNHIDRGSIKYPLMLYKNLCMKDKKYKITDDTKYLEKIINDKQWDKFLDIYTLNRIIRLIMSDTSQQSMLSTYISNFINRQLFRLNKFMLCWTIADLTTSYIGVLCYLLFIQTCEKDKWLQYFINTFIFTILSIYTNEKILLLLMCELFYPIICSNSLVEILLQ